MSGIQVRLSQTQFKKRLSEFIGKPIQVVFTNSKVVFGIFEKVEENTITLRNMRMKGKQHRINDITEVYFDKNQ